MADFTVELVVDVAIVSGSIVLPIFSLLYCWLFLIKGEAHPMVVLDRIRRIIREKMIFVVAAVVMPIVMGMSTPVMTGCLI
jgi:hypothetical protein